MVGLNEKEVQGELWTNYLAGFPFIFLPLTLFSPMVMIWTYHVFFKRSSDPFLVIFAASALVLILVAFVVVVSIFFLLCPTKLGVSEGGMFIKFPLRKIKFIPWIDIPRVEIDKGFISDVRLYKIGGKMVSMLVTRGEFLDFLREKYKIR